VSQKAIELLQLNLDNTKPINLLATSLNLTHRTLDRNFIRFLGLSPIKMLRLMRFNAFLDALHIQPKDRVNCFDFGYYDQSHFIKEFKNFDPFEILGVTSSSDLS
jgi:transcriptional regulator GlxA family with amidase domain